MEPNRLTPDLHRPRPAPGARRVGPGAAAAGAAAARLAVAVTGAALLFAAGCQQRQSGVGPPPKAVETYAQAVRAANAGDEDSAISRLEAATEANPDLMMARGMLGDMYKDKGRYEDAAEQYEILTILDPYTGHNFYRLGLVQQFMRQLVPAARNYRKAMKLDRQDWQSLMNLGLIYYDYGRYDEAVDYTQRATVLDPGAAPAWGNYGVCLDAKRRYPEAEKAYRRALELGPDEPATLTNLGANLMAQKKYRQAVTVYERLVKVADDPRARKRYGDALALSGRLDEALGQYRAALEQDARFYPAMNGLGSALIVQYKKGLQLDEEVRDAALDMWRKSLAIKPQQPKVEELLKKWEQS